MIFAQFEYRDYVSPWKVAIKFADIKFFGNENITKKLDTLKYNIAFEKCTRINKIIEQKQNYLIIIDDDILAKTQELIKLKHSAKIIINPTLTIKRINILKKQIAELEANKSLLENEIKKLNNEKFYNVYELKNKYHSLLSNLNFSFKGCVKKNNDIIVETYEYPFEDTSELIKKIDELNIQFEKKRKKDYELEK